MSEQLSHRGDGVPERQPLDSFVAEMQEWEYEINTEFIDSDRERTSLKAIEYLNDSCPYIDQEVYFSGRGIFPEYDREEGVIIGDAHNATAGMFGIGAGVGVVRMDEEDSRWRVLHKIMIGSFQISTEFVTEHKRSTVFCFLEPDSIIIPTQRVEEAYAAEGDYDKNKLHELLNKSSDDFVSLLNSPDFLELDHSLQRHIVEECISSIENAFTFRGRVMAIEGKHGYVAVLKNECVHQELVSIEDKLLYGECLGIDSLEQGYLIDDPIRSVDDLLDKKAGLCLVMAPDPRTAEELSLEPNQPLFIPISNQNIEVSFSSED